MVTEAITRRLVDADKPMDFWKIAINLETQVGDPDRESVNGMVTMSRRRLRDLLAQAASLGIAQQVEARSREAVRFKDSFPPRRIVRGIYRLRIILAALFGVIAFFGFLSKGSSGCGWVAPGGVEAFDCRFGEVPGATLGGIVYTLVSAALLWVIYRTFFWVWRGFRSHPGDAAE